eukprot:962913-Prorocentrum_minimum.AAC.3
MAGRRRPEVRVPPSYRNNEEAKKIFVAAAQAHPGETAKSATMGRQQFFKLCMETGLRNGATPLSALEVAFADNVTKGQKVLHFSNFLNVLALLAADKGETFEEVVGKVLSAGGSVDDHVAANYPAAANGAGTDPEAGGSMRDMAAKAFNTYAAGNNGYLDKQEVLMLLADVDAYPKYGINTRTLSRTVETQRTRRATAHLVVLSL